MGASPPQFGEHQYWEDRFNKSSAPFDWLEEAGIFDTPLVAAIGASETPEPKLLHIGCGTSLLSFHLRSHVKRPGQIWNIDFSQTAIEIGRAREKQVFYPSDTKENVPGRKEPHVNGELAASYEQQPTMHWATADLLNHSSLNSVVADVQFDFILDKSTCDSIACGPDVRVALPFSVRTAASPEKEEGDVHPLALLAANLAAVTKPGGWWMALSYSEHRFPWLNVEQDDNDIPPEGFPSPQQLWSSKAKISIDAREVEGGGEGKVHRPKTHHWLYVFRRTDTKVK